METLHARIKRHEGEVRNRHGQHVVYNDSKGIPTLGYGRNLRDRGITDEEAEMLLRNDIIIATEDARRLISPIEWNKLPLQVKGVLIEMVFQMGYSRTATFKKTLAAAERRHYSIMADEMLDSKWAREDSPRRAHELAAIVRGFA